MGFIGIILCTTGLGGTVMHLSEDARFWIEMSTLLALGIAMWLSQPLFP